MPMWIAATFVLGLALAMDSFAVTIANSFSYVTTSAWRSFMAPVAFAVFQGGMPVVGYAIGSYAASVIEDYEGIVTLVVLGAIGAKMIWDGAHELKAGPDTSIVGKPLRLGIVLLQALATSIDALAVGVTFVGSSTPIGWAALIITVTTFGACTAAWFIGRKLGARLGARAQIAGGVVLVIIGLKALLF